MINFQKIFEQYGQSNDLTAKMIGGTMFKNITDEEWDTLVEMSHGPLGIVLQRIQDEIFSYYTEKLLNETRMAACANKNVDASIYGGLLEGIYESSLRTLCEEGRRRQQNRKKETGRNKAKLPANTPRQVGPRL